MYIYFFEQALRLIGLGGRFACTVTNKWIKAGFAHLFGKEILDLGSLVLS